MHSCKPKLRVHQCLYLSIYRSSRSNRPVALVNIMFAKCLPEHIYCSKADYTGGCEHIHSISTVDVGKGGWKGSNVGLLEYGKHALFAFIFYKP